LYEQQNVTALEITGCITMEEKTIARIPAMPLALMLGAIGAAITLGFWCSRCSGLGFLHVVGYFSA